MTNRSSQSVVDSKEDYKRRISPLVAEASWVLRITEHKGKSAPVVVVKERARFDTHVESKNAEPVRPTLTDMGMIYGQSLRRCLPVVRSIVNRVCDPAGIPLELQRFFNAGRISFRGNLPLDDEAGPKLALIFKLQERLLDMDRVELIARRVERFSREEAQYWLTRATQFSPEANRWAQAGMRIMLGGQPKDKAVSSMLYKLQE